MQDQSAANGGLRPLLDFQDGLTSEVAAMVGSERIDVHRPQPPSTDTLEGRVPGMRIDEYVGCGGMGYVYKAYRVEARRVEAVKILREDAGLVPDGRRRLEREGIILSNLSHPGLVTCHGVGSVAGSDLGYLAMEWLEGCDLATLLERRQCVGLGPLPLEVSLEIVIQAARAVAAAHAAGVLHRDLKPANLMLLGAVGEFADGVLPPVSGLRVKVLDFGLAMQTVPGLEPYHPTLRACTEGYAAPEQRRGGPVDKRVDVYNLAATFYHLLTGYLPEGGARRASVLVGVDGAVDDFFDQAMHPEPRRRPATMDKLVEELERLRAGVSSVVRPPVLLCLRGAPDAAPAEWARLAQDIIRASPGVESATTGDPAVGVWVRARTPVAGAACGLRWLRLHPQHGHRVGAAHEANGATAHRLTDLAGAGQFFAAQSLFDQVCTDGLRDPRDPQGRNARFFVHGRYTWPAAGSEQEPSEVVGQICPAGDWGRDPFRPPAPPIGGTFTPGEEDTWHAGEQLAGNEPVPHCPGWTLKEKLGQGGYGEVWLASHPNHSRPRAFKFCHDALRLESFRRESEVLAELARTYPDEIGFSYLLDTQFAQAPFSLQSEYCPLGNLTQWLASVGGVAAVPLNRRVRLLARTARLVAKAHAAGIIHRDLKPANLLILPDDGEDPLSVRPRLADFGLSGRNERRRAEASEAGAGQNAPTRSGLLSGSRTYRAPEARTSTQSDVYALGVILYQLATGRFDTGPGQGFGQHVRHALLRRDIAAAIEQEPDRRPSARRLAELLEKLGRRRVWRAAWQAGSLVGLAAVCFFVFNYIQALAERNATNQRLQRELQTRAKVIDFLMLLYGQGVVANNNYAESARQQIAKYCALILEHPDQLTAGTLQNKLKGFEMFDGMWTIFYRPADLEARIQFADTCLDAARRGYETGQDRVYFSQQIVHYAQRCGDLRAQQKPAPAASEIRESYAAGLERGRYVAKHPGTGLSDLINLVNLLRSVALLDEKTGDAPRALAGWTEILEWIKQAATYPNNDPIFQADLDATTQEAKEALQRLKG